ncbi:ThrA Homoserine dehydrogenase [Burkholderiales bacterium]
MSTPVPLRVALAGLGTVGGGVAELLRRNAELISQRAGRPVQLVAVADLDQAKARGLTGPDCRVFSDALEMLAAVKPDVLVELIGGHGYAKTLVLGAIEAGVHVVTANKALLAVHGNDIFPLAEARGVQVGFEASVAGGIPIIKALREGLAANEIESVAGIINGTTNFILSEMRDKGLGFDEVLAQAQKLGYAEADPTFDVEGVDAAHKITLLAAIAFGMPLAFDRAHVEGIRGLASIDIRHAEELGHRIKLLGITRRRPEGVELRVHPTLVPAKRLLANVEGAMNAVLVNGDAVGHTLYYGKGAGSAPTASAVVADLIDLARRHGCEGGTPVPHLGVSPQWRRPLPVLPIEQVTSGYYLRLRVSDRPGVLADITRVLAAEGISIDAFVQHEPQDGSGQTDVVLITHRCLEAAVMRATEQLEALDAVLMPPVRLRVESFS